MSYYKSKKYQEKIKAELDALKVVEPNWNTNFTTPSYMVHKKPSNEIKKTKRVCLSCLNKFNSDGIHNRVCSPCKELDTWGQNDFVFTSY